MLPLRYLLAFLTGLLLASPSLVNANPLPAPTPKAHIIPFSSRHAPVKIFDSVADVKAEIRRAHKRAGMFAEILERSDGQVNGILVKRDLKAGEPYDINTFRRASKTKRQGLLTEELTNYKDKLVYGDLSVGTPSQTITVQFDTGSSDLLIPIKDCKACVRPFFEPRKSSTFTDLKTPFNTSFGDQSTATGYLASDVVALGTLQVDNQMFAVIDQASEGFDDPYSGLIGFGFQSFAQSKAKPWFFELADQGKLASNVISFYLSRQEAAGSEACVGCLDSTKFTGDVEYFPLYPGNASQALWTIIVQGMTYDNKLVMNEPLIAVFDTGGPYTVVPPALAKALNDQIPGSELDGDVGGYTFPCDKASSIAPIGWMFGTSSTVFNIRPSQLNLGEVKKGSNRCLSAILPGDYPGPLIGDAFLSSWYSVFDYGNMRMGFAAAV